MFKIFKLYIKNFSAPLVSNLYLVSVCYFILDDRKVPVFESSCASYNLSVVDLLCVEIIHCVRSRIVELM